MMRRRLAAFAVLLGVAGTGVAATVPAASAASASCVVAQGGGFYFGLQSAVNAAPAGETVAVYGDCTGDTTITKNLTLEGVEGTRTLDGGGQGTVLTIGSGARVTVTGFTITGGTGGGIINHGTLTVDKSTITSNTNHGNGGGIYNTGTLTLNGSSSISGNTAYGQTPCLTGGGGGIYNTGTLNLNGSSISGNAAWAVENGGGGGILNQSGSVSMSGSSSVSGNFVYGLDGPGDLLGGGIDNLLGNLTGVEAGVNVYDNIPDNIGNSVTPYTGSPEPYYTSPEIDLTSCYSSM